MLDHSPRISTDLGNFAEGLVPWYVIRVKPQCEWKAEASLTGRGFETFLPTCKKAISPRSRKPVKPLFPGYLFCRFEPTVILPILTAPGVLHVISFDSIPTPVDAQEIFALQTLSRLSPLIEPAHKYEAGQHVRVTAGPLAQVCGTVIRDQGKTRLLVSISLLQRTVICEVDREWVESIAEIPTEWNKRW